MEIRYDAYNVPGGDWSVSVLLNQTARISQLKYTQMFRFVSKVTEY